eukprot:EG_transcript_52246
MERWDGTSWGMRHSPSDVAFIDDQTDWGRRVSASRTDLNKFDAPGDQLASLFLFRGRWCSSSISLSSGQLMLLMSKSMSCSVTLCSSASRSARAPSSPIVLSERFTFCNAELVRSATANATV